MLRKEKLREVLSDTFGLPATDIDVDGCAYIKCQDHIACRECPYYLFWEKQFEEKEGDAT